MDFNQTFADMGFIKSKVMDFNQTFADMGAGTSSACLPHTVTVTHTDVEVLHVCFPLGAAGICPVPAPGHLTDSCTALSVCCQGPVYLICNPTCWRSL